MRATRSLSITLPVEIADMVEAKVASGEYASESDVIAEGLRPMAAHDAAIERWLRDEVVPTLQAIDAGIIKTRPLEETRKRLHARLDRMVGEGK